MMKRYPWGLVVATAVLAWTMLALAAPVRTWADDAYEPSSIDNPYDLSAYPGRWLSEINGLGQQSDNDWYLFTISQDLGRIVIECTFTNALGDIEIELYDATGSVLLGESASTSDNEFITLCAPAAGNYYLKVFSRFVPTDNFYDLRWQELSPCPDDDWEPNDVAAEAQDITNLAGTWLSTARGALYQADEDWYRITVPEGQQYVEIECTFTDADGDIDLDLYDMTKTNLVAFAVSKTDNERIALCVPAAGTYYLRVYFDNQGNPYDLWWDARFFPRWETCGAVALGQGWWWHEWFWWYLHVDPLADDWTYIHQLGWLFPVGCTCSELVLYDPLENTYWWTSEFVYPFFYIFGGSNGGGTWLWYEIGTDYPNLFYNLTLGGWN